MQKPKSGSRDEITFITPSMGTRWEIHSQRCIALARPAAQRIVVDGHSKWDPLYFVAVSQKVDTEFTVLVDEDCFLLDTSVIDGAISRMKLDDSLAMCGPVDGGTYHRHLNPFACNTYFLVARTKALRQIASVEDWRSLTFQDVSELFGAHPLAHLLDKSRIDTSLSEPYYPAFWAIAKLGYRIEYLPEQVNPKLLASEIHARWDIPRGNRPSLFHMWWLRSWFATAPDEYFGVSNRQRYDLLLSDYLRPMFPGYLSAVSFALLRLRQKIRRELSRLSNR